SPPKRIFEVGGTSNASAHDPALEYDSSDDDSIVDPRILSRSVRFLARENDFRKAENSTLRIDLKRIKVHMEDHNRYFDHEWMYTYRLQESLKKAEKKLVAKDKEMVEMKKQVDSWEKDFKNEASYVLRLDDMIEGLRKESLRRNEEMDKMKVELSEAGRMKRHVEELDCKYELLDYKNEMLARDKEYLEST
nr:hypothetical protein [Tanacetum cinerariifolium]